MRARTVILEIFFDFILLGTISPASAQDSLSGKVLDTAYAGGNHVGTTFFAVEASDGKIYFLNDDMKTPKVTGEVKDKVAYYRALDFPGSEIRFKFPGAVKLADYAHKIARDGIGIRDNYTDEYFYLKNGEKIRWLVFTSMHIVHLAKKPSPCCVRPQW